jgi:hypothetical protein
LFSNARYADSTAKPIAASCTNVGFIEAVQSSRPQESTRLPPGPTGGEREGSLLSSPLDLGHSPPEPPVLGLQRPNLARAARVLFRGLWKLAGRRRNASLLAPLRRSE